MKMGTTVVLVSMLCVFLLRDVQLLSAAPRSRLLAILAIYGGVNGICLTALMTILAPGRQDGPFGLAHASPLWIVGVAWHAIIWVFCAVLRRRPERAWLVALFPAPVLLLSLSGAALVVQSPAATVQTVRLGAILAACWWIVISGIVLCARRSPGIAACTQSAVDFASMTNITALVLLPLTGLVQAF